MIAFQRWHLKTESMQAGMYCYYMMPIPIFEKIRPYNGYIRELLCHALEFEVYLRIS